MPFSYYSPFTVNSGQVPSSQSDFPMLINSTDARFKTVGNGGHVQNSNGFDIRPYSDSGLSSSLTFELERYNATTGEVVMWIKRSSIADGTVTYLAYGDAGLSSDGSDGPNTFSNGFLAVYHLKDGTTLSVADSMNAFNGTNNSVTATTGQIDGAGGFASASSQYVSTSELSAATATTFSAWVKGTTFPNDYNGVLTRGASGSDNTVLFVKSNGKLYCKASPAGVAYDGTGSHTLSTATWYLLHMTYDSTNGLIGYVNAASDGTSAANGNQNDGSIALDIGRQRSTSTRYWNGAIDEARVASVARSANWITTEYNNQNAPGTFYTLGTESGTSSILNRRTLSELGTRIGSRQIRN